MMMIIESTKGYILSSYFWGYIIPQTIGGVVATQYGAAYLFNKILGVMLASVLCLAVPFLGAYPLILIGLNSLAGIINAFVCPSVSALMAKWSPPTERTMLVSIAYAGSPLGMAFGQPICGYICDSKWGWRGVYYVIFVVNVIWYIWFYFYVYSTPGEDPRISIEEKNMIISTINEFTKQAEKDMVEMDRESVLQKLEELKEEKKNKNKKGNKTKKKKGKKYIQLDDAIDDMYDIESSDSSYDDASDGSIEERKRLNKEKENENENENEVSISIKPVIFPESPKEGSGKGVSKNEERDRLEETSHLLKKNKNKLIEQVASSIEFNNTRNVRLSRINLQPTQIVPPEVEVVTDKNQKIPWKLIITNGGVLTIFNIHFANNWMWYTLMTYLPTFINGMYHLSVQKTTIISLFPYLANSLSQVLISVVADFCIKSGKHKIVNLRKFYVLLGGFGAAASLMGSAYSPNLTLMTVFMSSAVACIGFSSAMQSANMMDVSPHYAGIIMGCSNTFATIPGIICPILTSYVIGENPSLYLWRIVFCISSVVEVVASLIYSCFARGVSQRGL